MRVVVVGAGVAGLTAARDLATAGHEVLVVEAAAYAGGKLSSVEVGGVGVDVGAEAMLSRRPEGVDLAGSLGLTVTHPTDATSRIWTRAALRPLPRSLMGVPLDVDQVETTGILSPESVRRVREEPLLVAETGEADVTVGDLVDRRFGPEVTDRLVEPLLGGVYAGNAREISARAAVPQLVALAGRGSVLAQSAGVAPTHAGPVFAGLVGGMAGLATALVATGGFEVRFGVEARSLRRTPAGFALTLGPPSSSSTAPEELRADAVVVATPVDVSARLLADVAPVAATELAGIEQASVAVVTFAFRATDLLPVLGDRTSGFLVPPVDGRRIKAATFSFAKWDWVRAAGASTPGEELLLLRTSLGRHREAWSRQVEDADLVAASLADLRAATGLVATPVETHVQRWPGGFPQYALGHLDRVARIRSAVATVPGLVVCGAAYDGVGIPAVIGSAHRAAAELGAWGVAAQ